MIRREIQIFFAALMFFTRIPCPTWVKHSQETLNKASRYFPLIGWIVGAIGASVFWISSLLFPPVLAVLLSMIATILLTGAFHEDGFADVCDGFGGGWTQEEILRIYEGFANRGLWSDRHYVDARVKVNEPDGAAAILRSHHAFCRTQSELFCFHVSVIHTQIRPRGSAQ